VTVTVTRETEGGPPVTATLSQMVMDPSIRGSVFDQVTVTGSTDTAPANGTGSSTPAGGQSAAQGAPAPAAAGKSATKAPTPAGPAKSATPSPNQGKNPTPNPNQGKNPTPNPTPNPRTNPTPAPSPGRGAGAKGG
jgi:hypothetical protein